jgi:hypothetical protein
VWNAEDVKAAGGGGGVRSCLGAQEMRGRPYQPRLDMTALHWLHNRTFRFLENFRSGIPHLTLTN